MSEPTVQEESISSFCLR